MQDCIFCKISQGEIPSHKVYEDNHVLAFLDINPKAKGHTVIIPRVHGETIFDLDDELQKHYFPAISKVMDRIDHVLHPDGFNIGWNHHKAGGQEVPHLHVHVFPRWDGDGGGGIQAITNNPGDMSVEEVGKLFV